MATLYRVEAQAGGPGTLWRDILTTHSKAYADETVRQFHGVGIKARTVEHNDRQRRFARYAADTLHAHIQGS